jgi:hypothetical protein
MSYHLYIVKGVGGRVGFGIATNYKDRNKHYSSHSGDIVTFPVIYAGIRAHAKAVEKTIKNELTDHIWYVDDWKTEWLDKKYDEKFLEDYVNQVIKEKHCRLKVLHRNYDFTQDVD